MVGKAIAALKERGGSSRQAILKYIMANFNVGKDTKTVNVHLKLSLRAGVKNKSLRQSKGTGASGSFKIGEVPFPTLMRIVSAHIPYDVHEYLVFQKI
jgi:histone H1/5